MVANGKVFISHSTQDNEFVAYLDGALEAEGFETWVDYERLHTGNLWLREIEDALTNSAAVVVVMSKAARVSEWVERETLLALDLRKPLFIARINDMRLPLHLINRQYTDFSDETRYAQAVYELADGLRGDPPQKPPLPAEPTPDNFFPYVKAGPDGDTAALVARDLFRWARRHAGSMVEFGGKQRPAFHVRAGAGDDPIVFSVWAYARVPAVQVQFKYLATIAPYDEADMRRRLLADLSALLPDGDRFAPGEADKRPTIPLSALDEADKLERFKTLITGVLQNVKRAE